MTSSTTSTSSSKGAGVIGTELEGHTRLLFQIQQFDELVSQLVDASHIVLDLDPKSNTISLGSSRDDGPTDIIVQVELFSNQGAYKPDPRSIE